MKKQLNKSTIILIIIAALILIFLFLPGGETKTTEEEVIEPMPGYSEVTAVPGVSFYINDVFIDKATAITQVSNRMNFQKNQYYSYKNGTDEFLLFCMEDLIIAAKKNTDFWIDKSDDKEYALLNANLMNIWFTSGSKKFNTETVDNRTTTIAEAGVSINATTYGDFCGKLVNINKDGEEWSLYVGVPGERYDKLPESSKKGIENIISTFTFKDNAESVDQDIYAVSIDKASERKKVEKETEIITITEDASDTLNLNNQKTIINKEEDKAYTSTPYNMLEIGDNGLFSVFNDININYEEAIICPKNIYKGEEAEKIIREFCQETEQYAYFSAPEGSSWEVAEYDLNYKDCEHDDYVNIRLKGVDGEPLRYRGIKYSQRTYDMIYKTQEDGKWIRHYYVYYAIPNGCLEYCLQVGERESVNGEEVNAAYYHVMSEKVETQSAETTQTVETTEDVKTEATNDTQTVETTEVTDETTEAAKTIEE